MGSADRLLRLKLETRDKILCTATTIIEQEGWKGLNLRKLAETIDYTAPIIYEYFRNKEDLILEIIKEGFLTLGNLLKEEKSKNESPEKQLMSMWFTYWNFAIKHRELYQGMYGNAFDCRCEMVNQIKESDYPQTIIMEVIRSLFGEENPDPNLVLKKYYMYWSVVHGLISINILQRGSGNEINQSVLLESISGISSGFMK